MEIIHTHIFEPHRPSFFGKSKKSERSQLHTYTCEHKNDCDAFKNGTCINVGNVFGSRCPVGKKSISSGFTQRANGYYPQITDWKKRYKDTYQALSSAPKRITKVAGGWMLPYSYMDLNEKVGFKSKGGLFVTGCPFLTVDRMTKENLEEILLFQPQAMMGGTIHDYQKKVIPKFLHDFKVNYPELFNELLSDNIRAKDVLDNIDYVGREAYLNTIKPNTEIKLGTKYWMWDGKKIFKKDSDFMVFEPCKWVGCYAEFTPTDKATVKITSNEQVDSNTKFSD